ncbi:hypothetical protein H696_05829 [Fonticula alba]|uniref:Uncharacterized protein n=1 Tax=Fonticula alba TaxID=691883 RepID=A0A058Z0Q3_FONAL|nr:hypothetical protein H696_05829 [Fonticula alba]KCV67721.1 hypothetical protein H696_05829 [Fonticula alba]|eukprot:XP_009497905.1 hypothetical protein H696_05829 [Fonticula alba]
MANLSVNSPAGGRGLGGAVLFPEEEEEEEEEEASDMAAGPNAGGQLQVDDLDIQPTSVSSPRMVDGEDGTHFELPADGGDESAGQVAGGNSNLSGGQLSLSSPAGPGDEAAEEHVPTAAKDSTATGPTSPNPVTTPEANRPPRRRRGSRVQPRATGSAAAQHQ